MNGQLSVLVRCGRRGVADAACMGCETCIENSCTKLPKAEHEHSSNKGDSD